MAFSMMTPSIGIYLGTKYSCVGFWLQGNMEIIANDEGNTTTPSYVAFTPDRELIGEAAEIQADRNPTNTIFDINRLIGRRFSDPTVQSDRKLWPFNVIEGPGDKPKIVVQYRGEEKQFYPEELSAMILAKMKEIAEKFLHCSVQNAVVAVPAYFNDSQRFAIRGAGGIAGLNVLSIMDEPSAAALAYCFKLNNVFVWNVLVFDLSISTFDVSVVEYDGGVYTVKTTVGDMHLGGKDFDNRLLNYFLQQIKEEHKKDISDNPRSIRRLQSACEQAKKILSSAVSTTVEVASLYEGIDFSSNITKDQFDEINMDLFERCMGLVTKCLEDARLEKTDIDLVVLLGGNTQIPKVQKMLQELFDGKELCKSLSLNAVVAYGAILQSVTLNVAPHVALKEIENANKERIALQHELSEAQTLIQQLMSQRDDDGKLLEVAQKLTEQQMLERDDGKRLSESAQKLIQQLMYKRDDATKLSDTAQRLTKLLMSERDDARKLSEEAQKQLMSERDDARKLSKMTQKQLMRERDDARKCSEAAKKLTEQLKSERDDDKRLSEMAQKLAQQLISERDDAKKLSEAAQKLTEQLMSERDEATKLSEAAKKHTEQLMSERDDARKLSEAAHKQLMSERDDARKLLEMTHKQLMCERDDASKISETAQKLTEQLMSERDDAKKHSEAAQKLTEQLMYEREDAKKNSEAAQKLTEQLMYERDDAKKHSEAAQKLTEQLMSERDDAKKDSEAAHKLIEQLMSERDEAKKHSEAAQKLTEQLMSERDNEKKHSEADQKLIEQLISERDNAIKQVEELCRLREQQAPVGSKSVECFIEYSYSELLHATDNFHESVKLGEGGFGKVYKGILRNTTIAIKILNEESKQGAKAFHQEVEVLSKLEHPNLVKLIGACAENHALIYEYLPNGSLEDRLQCKNNTSPLSWQARVRIAFEICSALSFLHCSKPHGIVHGDLKPDNVLLDLNNVSKLGDFGLCCQLNRTTNASQPFHITDCLKGTFGYIDPEYFTTGKMTPRNDVYSFGIMLLQLVTCKDPQGIRQSVEEAHRKGTLKALIDATAGPWPFKKAEKMISLGLRCSDIMSINRPDLSTVVLKEMKSMADVASASQSLTSWAASLFRR